MRRCLLVFLSVLPLLVTGCKKGESNLTQSTPSPTVSSPTPVAEATPTPPPDTNRTAKFIVLLYHRFEDTQAELVTTPLTEPLNDQHITEPKPTIKANLASMGHVDPKSVEMRISGFGLVLAVYDPNTKLATYLFTQKLVPKMYTVILTAKVNGKKVETRWNFTVDPAGPVATNQ